MSLHPITFAGLPEQKPDALLALIAAHRADPRTGKIDVGVGVYRDERGNTPVMRAVKAAEAKLLAEQPSKSYLGADGDRRRERHCCRHGPILVRSRRGSKGRFRSA